MENLLTLEHLLADCKEITNPDQLGNLSINDLILYVHLGNLSRESGFQFLIFENSFIPRLEGNNLYLDGCRTGMEGTYHSGGDNITLRFKGFSDNPIIPLEAIKDGKVYAVRGYGYSITGTIIGNILYPYEE